MGEHELELIYPGNRKFGLAPRLDPNPTKYFVGKNSVGQIGVTEAEIRIKYATIYSYVEFVTFDPEPGYSIKVNEEYIWSESVLFSGDIIDLKIAKFKFITKREPSIVNIQSSDQPIEIPSDEPIEISSDEEINFENNTISKKWTLRLSPNLFRNSEITQRPKRKRHGGAMETPNPSKIQKLNKNDSI